nr:MAG TPA: hypothetical protein [Caudoviricetes sp.]
MQKIIFAYTEIFFCIYEKLSAYIRKYSYLRCWINTLSKPGRKAFFNH